MVWKITFALLCVLLVPLLWFPLAKINAQYTVTINEGFNAYSESAAGSGATLYGAPPHYAYANYPPVSFHLIGWLGKLTGDVNLAGRWISFLAILAIAACSALIVRCYTNSWRYSAYAALCWLIWLGAFDVVRVGYNDPHVLGVAVSMAALYCFVRDPESARGLISAALFAPSLFIKQSLFPFPLAVALQLFLTSRRRLAMWMGTAIGVCRAAA
ncbi:MAG: glycosyltransferase family 39 protein [Candidatus Solibacter sp.]